MANDSDPAQGKSSKDLIKLLIENKVISSAQAQLAMADQEVTGMTFDEVLLARRWVDEATLERLAPWLSKAKSAGTAKLNISPPSGDYEENLKHYRRLMEQILGEGWD